MSSQLINITLYSFLIVFDIIGLFAAIYLFTIMLLRRSMMKTDKVSYLLISNSYIALIVASSAFADLAVYSIYGHLYPDSSFDGWICRLKSYVVYVTGCVYFYSFLLQAIYRLFRIVYPTRIVFQSFRLYVILSVGLWIVAPLMVLPSLLIGDLKYLPEDYHCQLAPTDPRGTIVSLSFLFALPFTSTLICYFYSLYYVRTQTTALTTINQYPGTRRDLIILSRLIFLFIFINTVAFPHVLMPIIYAITGYLPSWVSSLEWLLTVFSVSAASVIQIVTSPHLRKLYIRPSHVQPILTMKQTAIIMMRRP